MYPFWNISVIVITYFRIKIGGDMEIRISKPNKIDEVHLSQIIDLIVRGGQIKGDRQAIRILIGHADFVGYMILDGTVICTATLKNPYKEYKEKVFRLADLESSKNYHKELGYIVTHPDFENQGHCQQLLTTIFYQIRSLPIYATTRKPSMIHILNKLGFRQNGALYNQDLSLMTYDPPVNGVLENRMSNEVLNGTSIFQNPSSRSISTELRTI